MKSICFIFIILFLNVINLINCTLSNNGVTLLNFKVSNQVFNVSTKVNPSVTIEFTIRGSESNPIQNFYYGFLNFNGQYSESQVPWSNLNFNSEIVNGEVSVIICVPLIVVGNCNILPPSKELVCVYEIQVTFLDYVSAIFKSVDINKNFPNTSITVQQNRQPPELTDFKIIVNPLAPLVTFQFSITYYSQSLNYLSISVFNGTSDSSFQQFSLQSNQFQTTNGQYYIEALFIPEIYGYNFKVGNVQINDTDNNYQNFGTNYLQTQFNSSTFQIGKSSSPPLTTNLYEFEKPSATYISANNFTLLQFDVYLNNSQLPILADVGPFKTYYQNSTWIKLYCTVPPYRESDPNLELSFSSITSYKSQTNVFQFIYENTNPKSINFEDVTFSVSEINKLGPFYIELNFTYQCYSAYLWDIFFMIPEGIYLYSNSLTSGTSLEGTSSIVFLFDSLVNQLSDFDLYITDSKGSDYVNGSFIGVPTNARKISNLLQLSSFEYTTNVIDLRYSNEISIPFIFETESEPDTYLTLLSISFGLYDDQFFSSPIINSVIKSSINESGYLSTTYQSFIQAYSNFTGFNVNGDIILDFVYYYGDTLGQFTFSTLCFQVLVNDFLPTIVTEFTSSSENPINSDQVSWVNYEIQFKGQPVDWVNFNFYETDKQSNYIYSTLFTSQISFPCDRVAPFYTNDTLLSNYQCNIPISGLPSQVIVFYLEVSIQGITNTIYNGMLQEYGFPNSIEIIGPEDTGIVPNITNFQTQFNQNSNTIYIQYELSNPSNISLSVVNFVIFNRIIIYDYWGNYVQISIPFNVTDNMVEINLCDLSSQGFDYSWQNIGLYISIPSPISNVNYQFPYEYLVDLDENHLDIPINLQLCDFTPPRLVRMGIVDLQDTYDTTHQSYEIQVYFDITDDISGFSNLFGFIQSNYSLGINRYQNEFNLVSNEGLRNNRYFYNFTIPQYTNGNFNFQLYYIEDNAGNQREFTQQNIALLSTSTSFIAVSSTVDPNLPSELAIQYSFVQSYNIFNFTCSGLAESLKFIPNTLSFYNTTTTILPSPTSTENLTIFNLVYNPQINPLYTGTYTFSLCLFSQSLSSQCFTWLDLQNLGLPFSFISTPNTVSL